MRPFFRRRELLILLPLAALLALLYWLPNLLTRPQAPLVACFYHDQTLIYELPLTKGEDRDFSLPHFPQVRFHLDREGGIRFSESNCPDKICIHAGRLTRAGQFAACLPNHLLLKIRTAEASPAWPTASTPAATGPDGSTRPATQPAPGPDEAPDVVIGGH